MIFLKKLKVIKSFQKVLCRSCSNKVVYSGIQPTGIPHIGNYLGAIKKWVNLQKEPKTTNIYSVVDLHSITIPKQKVLLQKHTCEMVACLLACGIDPKKSILYRQSDVPEHTLLSWVLSSFIPISRLKRFPQWKEKSKQFSDSLSLFSYPVLQSADILLYGTTHVPVGDDQAVHIHLTNEIVDKFNSFHGDLFQKVKIISADSDCTRVLNLKDAKSKMSKSSFSDMHRINITDSDDEIRKKIKKSITDCVSEVTYNPKERPGVSNLIRIHSGFSGLSFEEIVKNVSKQDTGQYKEVVASCLVEHIKPIRDEYNYLINDQNYLNEILKLGAEKAQVIADETWQQVCSKIGLKL